MAKPKKKKIQKAKLKTAWVITYNDQYGNGDQTSIEGVLLKQSHFSKWLKEHNQERTNDGEARENREEFDVTSVTLHIYKP